MQKLYDPSGDESTELLERLGSDRLYSQMCRNQKCFRARVSPKPWRIGIDRLRPRGGVWPVKKERRKEREEWVEKYDKISENFASCQYLQVLGSSVVHDKAEFVRSLHDDMANANRFEFKIA